MMDYKRKFVTKIYLFIFAIVLAYFSFIAYKDYKNSEQNIKINTLMDKTIEASKNTKLNKLKLKKVLNIKEKVLLYKINKSTTLDLLAKFEKIVNSSDGILIVKDTKIQKTKYINVLKLNITFDWDRELLNLDIAKTLMNIYINLIIKKKFSDMKVTYIGNDMCSIKVKK
jgi:hypothetical protein